MCLEYRHQRLNEQHQDIYRYKDSLLLLNIKKEHKEYRGSYINEFERKYIEINSRDYWYFESIEDFVRGKELNKKLLEEELKANRIKARNYDYELTTSILSEFEDETDQRFLYACRKVVEILDNDKLIHNLGILLRIAVSLVSIQNSGIQTPLNFSNLYHKITQRVEPLALTFIPNPERFESEIDFLQKNNKSQLASIFLEKVSYNELDESILAEAKRDFTSNFGKVYSDTFIKLMSMQKEKDFFEDIAPLLQHNKFIFRMFLSSLKKFISEGRYSTTFKETLIKIASYLEGHKKTLDPIKEAITILKIDTILEILAPTE